MLLKVTGTIVFFIVLAMAGAAEQASAPAAPISPFATPVPATPATPATIVQQSKQPQLSDKLLYEIARTQRDMLLVRERLQEKLQEARTVCGGDFDEDRLVCRK